MGQLASQPVTEKTISSNSFMNMSYSIGSCQGWRLTMEDAHCYSIKEDELNIKIFGVFDGHGGFKCSKYLSQYLPQIIINEFQTYFQKHSNNINIIQTYSNIIKNSFFKCDYDLYIKDINSGSTAILLIVIDNKHSFIVNTGDSRCILSCYNGCNKNLSYDHKPKNIGELIRISDAGGNVNSNRVDGMLALSRAFGDFNFKKKFIFMNKLKEIYNETQVTVEPEIIYHELNYSKDEFFILACDGIWDIFRNNEIIKFIKRELQQNSSLDKINEKIIEKILNSTNSSKGIGYDNMTLIIIALHNNSRLEEWYEKMKLKD
ncbi:type 2C protein phosphatase PTC4 [Ascoidea rubescens DSM 1968]|uniref:protein-serine/threonine phosphatase n=1 Tax=Ascoidea rubescens DSM 1968 TaxID=1344418 RepID=A0A1D2VAB1_9ASCO|nr:ser/thr protein phosphatase [Ascoidea rubescens DSM 1968]ODV58600.1 ser/thr protein phosphatase [Ascoidea rubescens DSM 1968]